MPLGPRAPAPRGRLGLLALPRRGATGAHGPGRAARTLGASALAKEAGHTTPDGLPVGSFGRLLAHLATLTEHRVIPAGLDERAAFWQQDEPTALQARAFELLGFTPASM